MISIFKFDSYIEYLKDLVSQGGKESYGLKGRFASCMGVTSSFISQVFNEEKFLSSEQGLELSQFLGHIEIEADYFDLLIQLQRSGTENLRQRIRKKMLTLKKEAMRITHRVPNNKQLSYEDKATYYSDWLYTAIRNLSAIEGERGLEDIWRKLNQPQARVLEVAEFLIEKGLCQKTEEGLCYNHASIHIDKQSQLVGQHHKNWRLKAIERMSSRDNQDLFFTSPMSLSRDVYRELVEIQIPKFIQSSVNAVGPSKSEIVACLNIDLFKF